jgi:hypothetical protein
MNPQFDLVMSLLNVPKYAPHAWPHLTQRSRAATALFRIGTKNGGMTKFEVSVPGADWRLSYYLLPER